MPVVLCRIDDRLVHGQVVEGWLRAIDANHIVIISDIVAKDTMQKTLLSLAVPRNVKVSSFAVEEASLKLAESPLKNDNLLLLFSNPQDVVRFVKNKGQLSSVNVGGMHYMSGKRQIFRTLSVDDQDVQSFRELAALNIELEGRVLPGDERISIIEVIDKDTVKKG